MRVMNGPLFFAAAAVMAFPSEVPHR